MALARSYELTERIADFTKALSIKQQTLGEHRRADRCEAPDGALLQEISTSLIQEGEVDALYERILDGAISLMAADMGSMQVLDPKRNELRLLAWRGFHPESAAFWDRINFESAHSSCGAAFTLGKRVIVPDSEACDFMAESADLDHYRLSNIRAVQSTPLVSRSGQLLGMISTHWREPHHPSESALQLFDVLARQAADLVERAQREQQLRLLASEAEHRARNVLATVQATVHLTQADTVIGFREALNGRIQALAYVHQLFVESRWAGADIHRLVSEELAGYSRGTEGQAQIFGPECLMEPGAAQAVAMILHELATNAAKYGALSVPDGRVQVEWSSAGGEPVVLRWIETGGPPVTRPKHRGFGSRVIEDLVRRQLKGELRVDWRPEGVSCEITLPHA